MISVGGRIVPTPALSRRGFAKVFGAGAAYAALWPSAIIGRANRAHSSATPQAWSVGEPRATVRAAGSVVRLSSNENPYGPSPDALKAMADAFKLSCRYPDEYADKLGDEIGRLHGVSSSQILLGDGSGEILKLCAAAFTSREKKLVLANPTFEALAHHAATNGAQVAKIDLTSDYSHDLPRMLAAANDAGLIYVCNPNNPTASITPKRDVRNFLAQVPRQTMVLVDEAYHHYVESSDYESVIPLVQDNPNLIVARTFSKIYGMAGLRCGYCVTRSENIWRMRSHQVFDSVNILALVAAMASLKDSGHVTQGRRNNTEVRSYVCAELDKLGFRYIPSHANFMMIDLRREARPVIGSMRGRGVEVGRLFPPLTNFMRVTIGTKLEMQTFVSAFREVMA